MKVIALVSIVFFSTVQVAEAASWSLLSITTKPQDAPKVVAAADKLMSSSVGKEFAGKLLLQAFLANGSDPATHAFVPIYKSVADREAFLQKLQEDPAWTEFQKTMADVSQPVSQSVLRTMKRWGDIVDTDHVWIAHMFQVSDPPAFLAALETLMASPTGKTFPGQVYLSEVIAAGTSPLTHVISVGYASEAEMDDWTTQRNASKDWSAYLDTSRKAGDYLGANLARDIKTWGPATMQEVSAP